MRKGLETFINNSPTAFHAMQNSKEILLASGFIELEETKVWDLKQEQKYFVTRNGSSIIAFVTPKVFTSVQIAATHLDSPSFKVKDNGEIYSANQIQLNVEKYGGMIASTWFDRPLSLAGRVLVETSQGLQSKLVNMDKDIAMIPNPPIHLNRTINEGHKYNIQKELLPVLGQGKDFSLYQYLRKMTGIKGEIVGADIFLYNRDCLKTVGLEDEYFMAPRIDNLECTYAVLQGILEGASKNTLNIAALFDNEEVGSRTKQGADSTFLEQVLQRVRESFHIPRQEYLAMLARGFMVSADNAHAVHPNFKELYDITNHPMVNEGIVIKHSANQAYTTDAVSAAIFRTVCKKAGVNTQNFYNHSNIMGGSTLGNIATSHVSLNSVDIGLPQWAMHSAYESAGWKDFEDLVVAMKYYYTHSICIENNNIEIA